MGRRGNRLTGRAVDPSVAVVKESPNYVPFSPKRLRVLTIVATITRVLGWIGGLVLGVGLVQAYVGGGVETAQLGIAVLVPYFWLVTAGIWLSRPSQCPQGHTDIGFYYGRWSCRPCYRLAQRGVGRQTERWGGLEG